MSFREKSDWASFVSLLLLAFYFAEVVHGLMTSAQPGPYYFVLFWTLIGVQVVIRAATHLALATRSPHEARAPADERELAIQMRSLMRPYWVLLLGSFAVIGTVHLGINTWQFAHGLLFVIWVSELVRYGHRLFYYRREA